MLINFQSYQGTTYTNLMHAIINYIIIHAANTTGPVVLHNSYPCEDRVQFQLIQREHGGGPCNCWGIMTDVTASNATFTKRELSDHELQSLLS